MPVYFEDDFNRADETFSDPTWIQTGTWEVVSNRLELITNFAQCTLYMVDHIVGPAQFIQYDVIDDAVTNYGRQVCIHSGGNVYSSGYKWAHNAPGATDTLRKNNAWVANTSGTWASGDTIRLEHNGSGVVDVYVNGSSIISYTDGTPLTRGAPGLWIDPGASRVPIDNLSAGESTVPKYVEVGDGSGGAGTSAVCALGATLIAAVDVGDTLFSAVYTVGAGAGAATATGWTSVYENALGNQYYTLLMRPATASEPADYTFTLPSGNSWRQGYFAVNGVNVTTPIHASSYSANDAAADNNTTAIEYPALTTTVDNVLGVTNVWNSYSPPTAPTTPWTNTSGTWYFGDGQLGVQSLFDAGLYSAQVNGDTGDVIWGGATLAIVGPDEPAQTAVRIRSTSEKFWGNEWSSIAAPANLTEGDILYVVIVQQIDTNPRSISGFDVLVDVTGNSSQNFSLHRSVVGATPPTSFTVTNGINNEIAALIAVTNADVANEVIGTPKNVDTVGVTTQDMAGITVVDDDSLLLAFTQSPGGTGVASAAGMTSARGGLVWEQAVESGPTGDITATTSSAWTQFQGVLVSLTPTVAQQVQATFLTEAGLTALTTAVATHASTKIIRNDIASNASAARTAGAAVQYWFCDAGTTPTNALAGDIIYTRS